MARRFYKRRPEASGQAFEDLIDSTNLQYKNSEVALIHKRATPIKALKTQGNRVLSGVFEKKSTVDYDGIYRGKALYFEAKNTQSETSFPLANIEAHQLEHFETAEKHGALCFVLIRFEKKGTIFYVPFSFIQKCRKRAKEGGRKSIAYNEFLEHCPEVPVTLRANIDYLLFVDKEIEGETA